jgi:hypothetical protein
MAPTEMIQTSSQMALAQPGTPPSSPNKSEHIVGWNNAHQFIDVLKAIVDMQIASAESRTVQTAQLTVDHLEQLIFRATITTLVKVELFGKSKIRHKLKS